MSSIYERNTLVGDFTSGVLLGMAGKLVNGGGVGGGTSRIEPERLTGGLRDVGVGGKVPVGGGKGGGIAIYRGC